VLSSGVAGTMMANGSGMQWSTLRNIALGWVLTLPAAILLSERCTSSSVTCSEATRFPPFVRGGGRAPGARFAVDRRDGETGGGSPRRLRSHIV